MNLSTIVNEFNLPLTRPERNLVSRIDGGTSALPEDRYEKLFKELAAAREVSAQLPDRQTMERQNRMEKAGRLKERLKMLRQMIPFLSPSAAKALKAEMKQIAAQLASLESEGGGTGSAMISMEEASVTAQKTGNPTGNELDAEQPRETEQGSEGAQQEQLTFPENALFGRAAKTGNSSLEDRQLRESIEELKKLYNTVLAALKRKLRLDHDHDQGHLPQQAPRLQVYTAWPDITTSVAIKV
ncbi:MAG: hypothetical protein HXX11_04400 [Desulfuromonadales bacterium]|nr:hypothetical protein [Desulfuromonadales bacterium]